MRKPVLVSINEEKYAAAVTELEKELTVLGAKRTDHASNYNNYILSIQPDNDVHLPETLYYEFSEASYQIVDVYLCKPLAREAINIEIAFLGTDGGKFFSLPKS